MKRSVDCYCAPAKRQCPSKSCSPLAECDGGGFSSSASPSPVLHQYLREQAMPQPLSLPQHGLKQAAPVLVEHALERTLCDADSALNLTLHAMHLATQIYECGAPDAADRALVIAEQALAATMQQLARAQALVVHKAQAQQHVGMHAAAAAEEEDVDLQDTCSSGFSASDSATACESF